MPRGRSLVLAGIVLAAIVAGGVAATWSAFSATTDNAGSSFSAKHVFPGVRSTYSWTIRDASAGGAEVNADDPFAVNGDGLTRQNATNWATTYNAARYLEWDFDPHVPAGIAVSGAAFNVRLVGATATDTICFYVATYVNSTNALRADHGAASQSCAANPAAPTAVALPELATTDDLDDLTVRIYVRDATAARKAIVDVATVTGTYLGQADRQLETTFRDVSGGGAGTTSPWSLAVSGDSATYSTASNVTNAFTSARYLRFTAAGDLPAGAVVTNATLTIVFASSTNVQSCYYTEASTNAGATLLGTHPTAAAPTCVAGSTAVATSNGFPEITTAAQANDLTFKIFVRNAGNRKLVFHQVKLDLDWYDD